MIDERRDEELRLWEDIGRARRMLTEFRGAVFVIALLSFVAMAWDDGRNYLLAVIALVAIAPLVAHADEPDPGEDLDKPGFLPPVGWNDLLVTRADYLALPGVLAVESPAVGELTLTVERGEGENVREMVADRAALNLVVHVHETAPMFVDPQGGER